jgi:hypothetical protein
MHYCVSSGKWYWEITRGTSTSQLVWYDCSSKLLSWPGTALWFKLRSYATDRYGNKFNNGSGSLWQALFHGDVIGIAYDADNGDCLVKKRIWQTRRPLQRVATAAY